jgi:hypothetical protein
LIIQVQFGLDLTNNFREKHFSHFGIGFYVK